MNNRNTTNSSGAVTTSPPSAHAPKQTTLTSIMIILLREHRRTKGIGSVELSKLLGYPSASAWTKVELGYTKKLRVNTLFAAAVIFELQPAALMSHVESIAMLMAAKGWRVFSRGLSEEEGDDLFSLVKTHKGVGFTQGFEGYGNISLPSIVVEALG